MSDQPTAHHPDPAAKPPARSGDGDPVAVSEVIAEAGVALSRCGFPVSFGILLLDEVADAYGRPVQSVLFSTTVMVNDRESGTIALRSTSGTYRFDQMARAQATVNDARRARVPARAATAEFRKIATARPLFPAWLRVIGYAASAAGFAEVFRLSLTGIGVATLLGALVGTMLLLTARYRTITALMPMLATFACALLVSAATVAAHLPDPVRLAAVPVLVLLPGAALTTATIELVSGDMTAGAGRLSYGIMQLLAMVFGFALAVQIVDVNPNELIDLTAGLAPSWVPWVGVVVFTIGTMLYFCTPLTLWLPTLAIVVLAYSVLSLTQLVMSAPLASGVASAAAFAAAWLANARHFGGPVSMVLFLPTFWLLVPGSLGFVAIAGAVDQNADLASLGTQAIIGIMAISIGVMVASLAVSSSRLNVT